MKKMVLVDQNGRVSIRNSEGVTVRFKSLEEFEAYTGESADIFHGSIVNYEPDRKYFVCEKDLKSSSYAIPHSDFEKLIDNVEKYADKKSDKYFNVTLEEAKKLKTTDIISAGGLAKWQPFDVGTGDMIAVYGGIQSLEEAEKLALLAMAKDDPGYLISIILENKNPDGSQIVRMKTAAQVVDYAFMVRDRNETINQLVQLECTKVMRMTTLNAVKNYPIIEF